MALPRPSTPSLGLAVISVQTQMKTGAEGAGEMSPKHTHTQTQSAEVSDTHHQGSEPPCICSPLQTSVTLGKALSRTEAATVFLFLSRPM